MDKKEFKITADGSHTLYIKALDETYHSKHGAIQEAQHVFIEAGLKHIANSRLDILEIGFGTGLNAFLTLLETEKSNSLVNYTSLEAYPLETEIIEKLNYILELSSTNEEKKLFNNLHQVGWENYNEITKQFFIKKMNIRIEKFESSKKFDLIYFDAFAPRVQPEMWEQVIFEKMYECLNPNGVLITYCAKGSVKRTMKAVGFEIESLPGPPGKREMTRAVKKI